MARHPVTIRPPVRQVKRTEGCGLHYGGSFGR